MRAKVYILQVLCLLTFCLPDNAVGQNQNSFDLCRESNGCSLSEIGNTSHYDDSSDHSSSGTQLSALSPEYIRYGTRRVERTLHAWKNVGYTCLHHLFSVRNVVCNPNKEIASLFYEKYFILLRVLII